MLRQLTLPKAISWGILTLVIVSLLLGLPNTINVFRFASDSGQISEFASAAAIRLLGAASVAVGFAITLKMPRNAVGWLFLASGLGFTAYSMVIDGAVVAVMVDIRDDSVWPSLLGSTSFVSMGALVLVLVTLQLFPDGRLPSASRTWVGLLAFTVFAGAASAMDFGSRETIDVALLGHYQNGWQFFTLSDGAQSALQGGVAVLSVVAFAATTTSVVVRYRRGTSELKQQIKWVALAAGLVAIAVTIDTLSPPHALITTADGLAVALVPIAAGVAILKYRLYDVDLIISRTLVYAPLTATLAGTYTAAIVFFRLVFVDVFDFDSDAAVATTTLAVAAMFVPVKNRFQRWVDRFFKDDERRKLTALGAELSKAADMLDVPTLVARFEARVSAMSDGPVRVALANGVAGVGILDGAASIPMVVGGTQVGRVEVGSPVNRAPLRATELAAIEDAAQSLARLIKLRRAGI